MPTETQGQPVVALMDRETDEFGLTVQPPSLVTVLMTAALDPRVDPEKLRAIYELQCDIEAREARKAFSVAMRGAQEEMRPIVKDRKGENNKYAQLETIQKEITPVITRHGFTLSFNSKWNDDKQQITISCACRHEAGHTENYELTGGLDSAGPKGNATKTPIQALGSSVSYLRRYLTTLIFNLVIVNEDDDGAQGPQSNATITQDQQDTIDSMLKNIDMDTPALRKRFWAWATSVARSEIKFLHQIPAKMYDKTVSMLEQEAKRLGK